ncbi:hypothetical protein [Ornithinibacillus halotolerans]|uniref:Uncharacterized protein n=1 Tax=Ornithinibacillus halotolerans TaxID=1274357 RepID=A0A916S6W4_9BACI|nr:hypothetical protein [Ornithinibacillus halotolerans]GGA87553.1 hypothetical protein GCM10008025_32930 [Ornithinibacillus halotolerans]
MTIVIVTVILIMFFYTLGFSITLWNEKNKIGSITVFILAVAIMVIPFSTFLKF